MKSLFVIAAAVTAASAASADPVVFNTLENGSFTGTGGSNGGTVYVGDVFDGSDYVGANVAVDFTPSAASLTTQINGTNSLQVTPNAGATYDGLLDLNTQQLFDVGGFSSRQQIDTAVLSFDVLKTSGTSDGDYNLIRFIANTDGTDGDSFSFDGDDDVFVTNTTGDGFQRVSVDITSLLDRLDPAVNPGYSSLRLLANRSGTTTGGFVFDNFAIDLTPIPEPTSVFAGLGGLCLLGMRRRR